MKVNGLWRYVKRAGEAARHFEVKGYSARLWAEREARNIAEYFAHWRTVGLICQSAGVEFDPIFGSAMIERSRYWQDVRYCLAREIDAGVYPILLRRMGKAHLVEDKEWG